MPMLSEEEYADAFRLYGECMQASPAFRERWNIQDGASIGTSA
jgi:hypothetical protein